MSKYFTIFGVDIHYYGLIMATAMLVGVILVRKLCKKYDINKDHIIDLALIVLPLAVLGARIYYCMFSDYSYNFAEFWDFSKGGLAIYGGVIGGFLGLIIFCLIRKRKILEVCDVVAPALILGQAMGRWGNFINQEAYGFAVNNPVWQFFPFAVYIEGSGYHLATFFYESVWNFIIFGILLYVLKKSKKPGTTTAMYMMLYGVGRFFIEALRTDSLYWGAIRVSQLVSLIIIAIGIIILIINSRRRAVEKK